MKKCTHCGRTKQLSEFSNYKKVDTRNRPTKGKIYVCTRSWCKSCIKERKKVYDKWYRENVREKRPDYLSKHLEYQARHRAKYPEKIKARSLASYHGIRKDKCDKCGIGGKLHMHHPNYLKPLDVITLCVECHVREHATT